MGIDKSKPKCRCCQFIRVDEEGDKCESCELLIKKIAKLIIKKYG
jgi:hypothetical protein